ncbi:hypothetical protein B005_1415 [Nocardiopsis alba ATCC BAA-2165]|uniref:Uncharacterized protein n=1 Tax=Nocardiopsis alba (strain ATCC BAA-2165 / BE74) TaxID=1205910 RepID=J7L8W8_NOCAA|nr:hypothetical protein B005_1415 [Nocardiopsis alba ATCC BAA-2165]
MNVDRSEVHPRVRGEQTGWHRTAAQVVGPSPRARGAGSIRLTCDEARGSIPACAGSRRSGPFRVRVGGVHPRVRGEQRSRR